MSKRKKKIEFIRQNQHLSTSELAAQTGILAPQIDEILNALKAKKEHTPVVINRSQMDKRTLWGCAFFLFFAVILFYLPIIKNEFVNWDDPDVIIKNIHIRSLNLNSIRWMLSTFYSGNWMPLTWFSFALNFWMGGVDPKVYHLTNLFLHSLNTLLVFLVCHRILGLFENQSEAREGNKSQAFGVLAALITALLFGLHPIHVESVAWATERKDVLYAFFYLLGILFYLDYASSYSIKPSKLYTCLGLFLLSLMSKPMAVTLPLVFLILDYWPLKRFQKGLSKLLIEKIPFFAMALLVGIFSIISHEETLSPTEVSSTGIWSMNSLRSLVFYPWKMLVPLNLVPLYPFPHNVDTIYKLENMLAAILVILVTIGCFSFRKIRPYLWAAWLFYLTTLAPVVGFLQFGYQSAADRYTYLPSLSMFLLFSAGVTNLLWNRRMIMGLFVAVLTTSLGYGTLKQLDIWRNSQTLWESVVKVYPGDSAVAYTYLGETYTESKRWDDAMKEFNLALAISPSLAKTHQGLGGLLFYMGRVDEAIQEFKTAISLDPQKVLLYQNLWNAYERLGKHEDAIAQMQEAIHLDPNNALNYSNLGVSYSFLKKYPEAEAAFQRTYDLEPNAPQNLLYLATIHLWQGHLDKAMDLYQKGIEQNPRAPVFYLKLAEIYTAKKMPSQAIEMLKAASDLNPQDPTLVQEMKEDFQRVGQKIQGQ